MKKKFTTLFLSICLLPLSLWSQCSTADCPSNNNTCNGDPTCCLATGTAGNTIDDCLNTAGITKIRLTYNATISSGTDATNVLICPANNNNISIADNVTVDNTTCFAANGDNDIMITINMDGDEVTYNAGAELDVLNAALANLSSSSLLQNVVISLPVELISYGATATANGIQLDWSTATEHNNKYFLLERSSDGRVYKEVTTVAAQEDGTQTQYYQYTDVEATPGINYYRLTQFDFDGTKVNLGVVPAYKQNTKQFFFSPNPVASGDRIFLDTTIEEQHLLNTHFQLINTLGQSWTLTFEQGTLAIPTGLSTGLYYLTMQHSAERIVTPINIQ